MRVKNEKRTKGKIEKRETFFVKLIVLLYAILLFCLTVYSYTLVDLNLTLINSPLWNSFRENIIQIGYFRRDVSWLIFLALIIGLALANYYFPKNYKIYSPLKLSFVIVGIVVFSYPFLSHDFFNYMFDAKILTHYHLNPYLYKALDFPTDPWLRFMHWTHRTYPYGPTFIILTLVPSFFAFGKLLLNLIFFKMFFAAFYLLGVFTLSKIDKKSSLFFATSPLIIIEGLTSSHNDLVAVSLGFLGIYFYLKKKKIGSIFFILLSGGIKYITLPLIALFAGKRWGPIFALGTIAVFLMYLSIFSEIQPWYFLSLLIFLPFFASWVYDLRLFFFGLLLSYYPYIRLGGWDTKEKVFLKHSIILVFFCANLFYLLFKKRFIISKTKFLMR